MRQAGPRAVRQRIGQLPEEPPTADELAAIKEATIELSGSKSISLKELRRELGHRRQQSRAKEA
jgi:hypothetical protein